MWTMTEAEEFLKVMANALDNTFYTAKYKSCYIHSKAVNGKQVITWTTPAHRVYYANTWVGAQRAITKWEREQ